MSYFKCKKRSLYDFYNQFFLWGIPIPIWILVYIISTHFIFWVDRFQGAQSGNHPDSKVHGANMGPTWGRQDPGGPHVGPMDLAIWATVSNCHDSSFIMNDSEMFPKLWSCLPKFTLVMELYHLSGSVVSIFVELFAEWGTRLSLIIMCLLR